MNFKRTLLALAGLLASLNLAAAPVVSWTTSDSHVYAHINGFESTGTLANNTVLTNQFAAEGIVFSGTARANGCGPASSNGWSAYGMTGQNYVNNFGPNCSTNSVVDTTSMKFGSDVSRLAIDAYFYQSGAASSAIQLFDDGNLVGNYTLDSLAFLGLNPDESSSSGSRQFYNYAGTRVGILTFDGNGSKFDEVRFVESAEGARNGDYVFFDNARFDANTVPEPASLALVAVGLAACTLRRRKA